MLAGPERVVEPIQRRQIAQRIRHDGSLPRDIEVVLAVADEDGARYLIEEPVQRKGAQLREPVERRCRAEGPEALVDDEAEAGRRGRVGADPVHFAVKGRRVTALEQRYQRRGDVGFERRLQAVHAVDDEHGGEAVVVGGGAGGEGGAEGKAHKAKAGHVDVQSRAEVVDDGRDDLVPLQDEAEVLVPAHGRLAGALVRDEIPAAGEDLEADRVQGVFLGGVVAASDEDRRLGLVAVGVGRAVDDGGDLEPVPLEGNALAGYRQQGDGLVKGGGLQVPQQVDAGIGGVAVEEEIGSAEIGRDAEIGFTC